MTVTTASAAEITGVYVSTGDTVAAGDLLYTQDDSELDEQIEEYEQEITTLEEELDDCYEQLAQLSETMAALTVTAPFSGRITEVAADAGDSVMSGGKLAVLVDDSQMTLTQYFSYVYEDEIFVGMDARRVHCQPDAQPLRNGHGDPEGGTADRRGRPNLRRNGDPG